MTRGDWNRKHFHRTNAVYDKYSSIRSEADKRAEEKERSAHEKMLKRANEFEHYVVAGGKETNPEKATQIQAVYERAKNEYASAQENRLIVMSGEKYLKRYSNELSKAYAKDIKEVFRR